MKIKKSRIVMLALVLITALTLTACGNAIDNAISDAISNISDAITDAISDSAGDANAGGNDDTNAGDTDTGGSDDNNADDTDAGDNDDTNAGDTDADDNTQTDGAQTDNTPNPGDTDSAITADMVDLDDLLGEWVGFSIYTPYTPNSGASTADAEAETTLRITREGGEYKILYETISPHAGEISWTATLTAKPDGTILRSGSEWVNSGAPYYSLGESLVYTFDGTTLRTQAGGRYERVSAPATAPPISVSVGDVIQFAGYDWRVLDVQDGKALLLSDTVLVRRQYHTASAGITWAESSIRQFLNGEFYNNTFSEAEKALIIETDIVTKNNPWFDTPGGADTRDSVFLLSIEEVVQYFGDSGLLAAGPGTGTRQDSIFDEYDSVRAAEIHPGADGVTFWWLRSPAHRSENAAYVGMNGAIRVGRPGNATIRVSSNGGIRPALWLIIE